MQSRWTSGDWFRVKGADAHVPVEGKRVRHGWVTLQNPGGVGRLVCRRGHGRGLESRRQNRTGRAGRERAKRSGSLASHGARWPGGGGHVLYREATSQKPRDCNKTHSRGRVWGAVLRRAWRGVRPRASSLTWQPQNSASCLRTVTSDHKTLLRRKRPAQEKTKANKQTTWKAWRQWHSGALQQKGLFPSDPLREPHHHTRKQRFPSLFNINRQPVSIRHPRKPEKQRPTTKRKKGKQPEERKKPRIFSER